MKKLLLLLFFPLGLMAQNEVLFSLTGALQPTSVSIRAKLTDTTSTVRAAISTANPPAAPFVYSNVATALENTNKIAALQVTGLQPNTTYYYQIEADGVADTRVEAIATFKTPAEGAQSFVFMAGSCNREPNTNTYDDFLGYNPLFYLNCGDLHYADPNSADVNVHRNAFEDRVFSRPKQVALFRNLPFSYVWDDHDYCGNDDDGPNAAGAVSAGKAYKEYIPHYDFAQQRTGSDTNAIYQAYTIGRVRFIMSDLRSQRGTGSTSSAMGAAQKQWFKNELIQAKNNNQLICWVGSYSWYGTLDDNWRLHPTERRELSEFMRDNAIENMFIINGDAHMFAIDNGTNGDFTAAQDLPYLYPVMQAGPIENNGSYKGGTYSEGTFYQFFIKAAQYGVVRIDDNGSDSVCVTMEGYKKDLNNGTTSQLVTYSFCRKIGFPLSTSNLTQSNVALLQIQPNPSKGIFTLQAKINEAIEIEVWSAEGRLVAKNRIKSNEQIQLDLSHLASGVYTLNAETSTARSQSKLMIQK
jgi:hypothetical protein